jgi:DNA-binding GntR family transcriptional regulator
MRGGIETAGVKKKTMAEGVYQALKRDIITLKHPPGASVTEQELANLYGSSRVPVREACGRLLQEGLLTAIPYKGYFVNQISVKDIRDCFELRGVLESQAMALAEGRYGDDDIRRLEELAATEYTFHDWSSYADFLERNLDFHVQVAALSGNDRLVGTLFELLGTMQRFFFLGLDHGDFGAEMRHEHQKLVSLLKNSDIAGATACLKEQILASRDRILRALIEGKIEMPLE